MNGFISWLIASLIFGTLYVIGLGTIVYVFAPTFFTTAYGVVSTNFLFFPLWITSGMAGITIGTPRQPTELFTRTDDPWYNTILVMIENILISGLMLLIAYWISKLAFGFIITSLPIVWLALFFVVIIMHACSAGYRAIRWNQKEEI